MEFLSYYLLGWLPVMGSLALLWLLSVRIRNVSIVDIAWGPGFVLANAGWFFLGDGDPARKMLLLALVSIWGLRLGAYLAWRNIGKPEDFRYQQFRKDYGPERYWWISFFQVFLLQGVLLLLISLPLAAANFYPTEAGLNVLDFIGVGVWIIGFAFEAGGDWQLAKFKANPQNKGKVMDKGFWRYTRHPNYFGDSAVWWGFAMVCMATGSYWGIIGSVLMTAMIIKVSGVTLLEKTLKQEKPQYAEYVRKTSAFFPWWPKK